LILHPRTLEVLRPLGVTQALLAMANTAPEVDLQLGRRTVRISLADLALPDTAFPHLSLIRQTDAEMVLAQALTSRGVTVERGTELLRAWDGVADVRTVLQSGVRAHEARFDFVVGCDGPGSTVRAQAGIEWPGRPYPVEVVLADLEFQGDLGTRAAHVVAARQGLVFLFPLGEQATWRLLATRPAPADPPPSGQPGPAISAAELQELLSPAGLGPRITHVPWSARVSLQRRLADRFRQGRLFLAGDAAHAYSPATGQGMNAGIQDATNLGWKLAFASPGPGSAALLDSYDRERRPVARQVLAMTHLAFWGEAYSGAVPSMLRGRLAPLAGPALPALVSRRGLVAAGIRVLSQLTVSFRRSPLSVEGTPRPRGGPRPGDRLPDQTVVSGGRSIRLHELLAQPGAHVLLDRDADLRGIVPFSRLVSVRTITSRPGRGLMVVRPDGYIGFRCGNVDVRQLSAWLERAGAGPQMTICGTASRVLWQETRFRGWH
jgi:2-polyprenyl-6-methoxyphenol hydroxylase-like FAD-dependent oxidoreductase